MVTLIEKLQQVAKQLPGCLHTSVVDRESGLALASSSEGDPLQAAGADAYHSDLYRLSEQALQGMLTLASPEGIVLSSRGATFVSLPLKNTGFVWLVVTKSETTVGFTQAIMRKSVGSLAESLEALV